MEDYSFKKLIKISEKETKEMTFEETLKRFKGMIFKEIRTMNGNLIYNQFSDDDMEQELSIELWNAFNKYDIKQGNCFSTYVHFRLKKGINYFKRNMSAKKRNANGLVLSIDSEKENSTSILDEKVDEKSSLEASSNIEATEMYQALYNACRTDKEKELLNIIMNKQSELLAYAERHNISRQAANRQVKVMRHYFQHVLKSKGFVDSDLMTAI